MTHDLASLNLAKHDACQHAEGHAGYRQTTAMGLNVLCSASVHQRRLAGEPKPPASSCKPERTLILGHCCKVLPYKPEHHAGTFS